VVFLQHNVGNAVTKLLIIVNIFKHVQVERNTNLLFIKLFLLKTDFFFQKTTMNLRVRI